MTAEAHFCCRQSSHPFSERRVSLTEPAKIGRSVAKCRPSPTNAVFDCKVLSRNHALIWFDNGKFYLQDTKSSNGTFINNQRLSRASEESSAVEVNSCDVVQFGVDVIDTAKKVTHGCIVSMLRLYLPNGEEFKQNDRNSGGTIEKVPSNSMTPNVQFEDLYQLQQYIQEALHREQMLEQKLALLQRHVDEGQEASAKGWEALIDEDKLLSRLEFLENQLHLYKSQDEDTLRAKLQLLEEEKYNYESTSKETLRQALKEKLEAVQKVASLEFLVGNLEDECTHYKQSQEDVQQHLKELSAVHQTKLKNIEEMTESKKELETSKQDIQSKYDALSKEKTSCDDQYLEKTKQLQMELLNLKTEYDEIQNHKETSSPESCTEVGVQVGDGEKVMRPSDFYLNLTTDSKEEFLSEKLCQECRKKFPSVEALSTLSPPKASQAVEGLQQNTSKLSISEENSTTTTSSSTSVDESVSNCSSLLLRENGLPFPVDGLTSVPVSSAAAATSLSNEQLVAEESRLKLKLTETERELGLIRSQILDGSPSDSISLPQADGDVLTTESPAPKNKPVKKSSLLKMPSVKFGKKSSKKKAILSESDCSELSSLIDESTEVQKELNSCKEQLETKTSQVFKLEKEISTLHEDAKNYSELCRKVEHLESEQKEVGELRVDLRNAREEISSLNNKYSTLQDDLRRKVDTCSEWEGKMSKLREELTTKTQLLEQHENSETTLREECQRLQTKLSAVEDEKRTMEEDIVELRCANRITQEKLDEQTQQTQELLKTLNRREVEYKKRLAEHKATLKAETERSQRKQQAIAVAQNQKFLSTGQTVIVLVVAVCAFVTLFIMENS